MKESKDEYRKSDQVILGRFFRYIIVAAKLSMSKGVMKLGVSFTFSAVVVDDSLVETRLVSLDSVVVVVEGSSMANSTVFFPIFPIESLTYTVM